MLRCCKNSDIILGVLPEKLGRVLQPASQNPYPIYDQILWFSLPYIWPDQKFDTLFIFFYFFIYLNDITQNT